MSLLDKGNADILLYPEEVTISRDGNVQTRAAKEPVKLRVWLAPVGQSGTSARRAEQDNEGFETEKVMRMRIPRANQDIEIGAQSKIVWRGQTWSVFGDVTDYIGSPRTAHRDYMLRRA